GRGGAPASGGETVQAPEHVPEIAREAQPEREPAFDHLVTEQTERSVEVLDGFEEAAAIVERLRDVLVEDGALLRIAAVRVQLQVELRRLLEEVEGFARRRRLCRLGAGAEEELLGALDVAALAVVEGEHAGVSRMVAGQHLLHRGADVAVQLLASRLEEALVGDLL